MQNLYKLAGYVLQNWEAKVDVASDEERGDIEVFLEDLRRYTISPSLDNRFFARLNSLNTGPLRAFVSGSCFVQQLDTILPMFFDGQIGTPDWRGCFNLVGEDSPV
jgi:hypothetical protein